MSRWVTERTVRASLRRGFGGRGAVPTVDPPPAVITDPALLAALSGSPAPLPATPSARVLAEAGLAPDRWR